MIRIYEVNTELADGTAYSTYRIAAKNFAEVVKKATKENITPYLHLHIGERISEVKIMASEDK